ncbi:uncharacterized protein HGUI_03303 [Hanseniaspora guilliermondii]|uniref:Uncharacterized protein n=1 Tax=Hanseniaspora guilliermondii TaxID=56406 RepID=A0A1L0D1V1_9ASCO|nr:uncharacterized protein HGUI_03303 [Hanseniaspora guilliermondii]
MFSRFRPSCLILNNIINKRASLIRKYTTDRVQGNPLYTDNVVLYKYFPTKWESLPFRVVGVMMFLYVITFSSTYMSFLNNKVTVMEETAEELQQRMDNLETLEKDFANKRINYPFYILKKSIYNNNETYVKVVNDMFCLFVASIGATAAYTLYRIPKKIIVEIAKLDNKLVMKTLYNKNLIELPQNSFSVRTIKDVALKNHETCILYAFGSEEKKELRQKKILNFKDLYMLKIEGAHYPNDWSTFQFYVNKK